MHFVGMRVSAGAPARPKAANLMPILSRRENIAENIYIKQRVCVKRQQHTKPPGLKELPDTDMDAFFNTLHFFFFFVLSFVPVIHRAH